MMADGCVAGSSESEVRHIPVEGTSFNPNAGSIKGLTSLDPNLEVGGLSGSPSMLIVHDQAGLLSTSG
jgi:regulator of RNase E activity RraA